MELLDALAETYRHGQGVFAKVSPAEYGNGTPCPLFDVQGLVNHTLGVMGLITAGISGGGTPTRDADLAGDDPGAAFASAAERSLAAWEQPGVLQRTLSMPWGESTGERTAYMNLVDTLAHTWDLAAATGQHRRLPDGPALVGLAFTHQMLQPEFRSDAPDAAFGLEVAVPDDASAGDRLIGFIGRDPAWPGPVEA